MGKGGAVRHLQLLNNGLSRVHAEIAVNARLSLADNAASGIVFHLLAASGAFKEEHHVGSADEGHI